MRAMRAAEELRALRNSPRRITARCTSRLQERSCLAARPSSLLSSMKRSTALLMAASGSYTLPRGGLLPCLSLALPSGLILRRFFFFRPPPPPPLPPSGSAGSDMRPESRLLPEAAKASRSGSSRASGSQFHGHFSTHRSGCFSLMFSSLQSSATAARRASSCDVNSMSARSGDHEPGHSKCSTGPCASKRFFTSSSVQRCGRPVAMTTRNFASSMSWAK
mmetsp:Transcript_8971/g.27923  ORF Transcript_8971/g.27923 Transcript_8971/m.27923 type:complete len:220 (-) Transcript_8971:870-1529(-)